MNTRAARTCVAAPARARPPALAVRPVAGLPVAGWSVGGVNAPGDGRLPGRYCWLVWR